MFLNLCGLFKISHNSIFNTLKKCYNKEDTFYALNEYKKYYLILVHLFKIWLTKFCDISIICDKNSEYINGEFKSSAKCIYGKLKRRKFIIKLFLIVF